MTIHYDPRQSVSGLESYSPSAGKPADFVELAGNYRYDLDGPAHWGDVQPVTRDDLVRVHHPAYVEGVFAGTTLNGFENRDPRVPTSCLWTIGSLLAAARSALGHPAAVQCSPSSGFHHAGYAWGGGFCTFNGLLVVAARLLAEKPGLKIGILDCDFHYGDGTVDILKKLPDLAKSIRHHTSGLHFHAGDDPDEFSLWLDESIADLNAFGCDLVLYQAGADMHIEDPLGGLLDDAQMRQRDRTVFTKVRAAVAWNLAGGYRSGESLFTNPVLQTHRDTLAASRSAYPIRCNFHPIERSSW